MDTTQNINISLNSTKGESYFDGGLLQLFGWQLIGLIVTGITLGIAYPWVMCKIYGWKIKHTVIEGKRLKFNGTAMGLFGNYIKWLLFTFITFGIYGFWLTIKLEKWRVKHTAFQ